MSPARRNVISFIFSFFFFLFCFLLLTNFLLHYVFYGGTGTKDTDTDTDFYPNQLNCFLKFDLDYGFSIFLTLWPKKLETQLLWLNVLSLHFILEPILRNRFQIIGKDQKKVFTLNMPRFLDFFPKKY